MDPEEPSRGSPRILNGTGKITFVMQILANQRHEISRTDSVELQVQKDLLVVLPNESKDAAGERIWRSLEPSAYPFANRFISESPVPCVICGLLRSYETCHVLAMLLHYSVQAMEKLLKGVRREYRAKRDDGGPGFPLFGECYGCGVRYNEIKSMKRCSSCKIALYCSPECQRMHWPVHKLGCKLLSAGEDLSDLKGMREP
ncbi:hypothetical protein DFJ74DRAFT_733753 [Hyaloraphidium curvatum]|nr:hypothetical protein DFJ74DRAFT_733753 [Hyaloraphidium curvatum]